MWAKSVRELSAEAMAADEIERNGNLDSNLEGMSTMDMESNSSYINDILSSMDLAVLCGN